jgi:hypothetical protein
MLHWHLARNGRATGHVREDSVARWRHSDRLSVQVWEDLTQNESHHFPLDYADQLELDRLEKVRNRFRRADTVLLPLVSYLALMAATLTIPWGALGQIEQTVVGLGLVGLWLAAIYQSIRNTSPQLITAIILTRRFRPGQHVWVHALRPGFVHGIVTGRSRARVVVRPLGQDTPIPLSPAEVQIVPLAGTAIPLLDRSGHTSASFSE